MINVHWMSDVQLAGLLFREKLYSKCEANKAGVESKFKLVVTCKDLDFGIKNKNLWVKNIEEI